MYFRERDMKSWLRFLSNSLVMCLMFGWPTAAICAEQEALADINVLKSVAEDAASNEADSIENPALLSYTNFDDCDPRFGSFISHAGNYLELDPVNKKTCVAGIGENHIEWGQLITYPFPVSRDVWMSGYVYFPVGFQLPAVSENLGTACYGGVHVWRLHQGIDGTDRITLDFNVPAGLDIIQLYLYTDTGLEFAKNTKFKPGLLEGKWQYWQVHVHLGTPGNSDGFLRFYAGGAFVDSMEKQAFLPAGADATWGFSYADVQSNIGGCTAQWPVQNGWLVGSVRVCQNNQC